MTNNKTSTNMIKKIGIIGLGVIGASLGMSLRHNLKEIKVMGRDLNKKSTEKALEIGAIDGLLDDKEIALCDLIIIATPLQVIPEVLSDIRNKIKEGAILSDVGSVKGWVMQQFRTYLPTKTVIIGGHPLAGSERSGITAADKFLLQNAAYVLTPEKSTPLEETKKLSKLFLSLGCRVTIMTAEEHDKKVAKVSHLPHLMAATLINNIHDMQDALLLAGGGLRDSTRIAASNPELWKNILSLNSEAVTKELYQTINKLELCIEYLNNNKISELSSYLAEAQALRNDLPVLRSCLQNSSSITAIIPDQPGAIGKLGMLMAKNNINIKDIHLLGVRDEDEGSVSMTVNSEDADRACKVLKNASISAWLRE